MLINGDNITESFKISFALSKNLEQYSLIYQWHDMYVFEISAVEISVEI